ncbi:MAG: GNAT family N-acetyltransferase [Hespellia sp.]|nr:GNAT family N-acetyltransferase [Hespellia sp.]
MSIKQAVSPDLETIKNISTVTISEIYPHYYPKGAVEFFLKHHNKDNILKDIENKCCFLCLDALQNIVGTVTIKGNEISRLFVLPPCQRMGYGTELLDFAEKTIFNQYSKVIIDASLPAKNIYLKRGFKDKDFNIICTKNNDFLCYDIMEKQL